MPKKKSFVALVGKAALGQWRTEISKKLDSWVLDENIKEIFNETLSAHHRIIFLCQKSEDFGKEIFALAGGDTVVVDELFSAADAYIRNPDLEGVEAYLSAEALLDDLKKFSIGLLNAFRKVSAKSGEVPAGFMNFRHDLQHHPLEKREVKEPEAAPPVYLPHRRNRLLRHYEDWIKKIGETLGQAGQATVEQKAVDRAAGGLDAAVTGQGGIGKTAMANEYAWTHQADYPGGVFWLQMDLGPAQALTEAANRLGWAIPDNLNDQQVRDLVLRKIGESRGLKLIVLDNLEEPAVPAELNLPDAHLLVTTRRTDVDLPPVKMDLPPEDDALDIFLGYADLDPTDLGEAETPAARAICERVGFLPLALEILGKVARKTALADLTDDLGDVLEHQATVHGKKGEILSIGAALALAESQYGHARAVEALTYLGYFHPEHIDPGLLGLVMEVEEEEAREILEALAEFSVIQPRHEAGGYVAHRLVQEAARGLDPQKQAGTRVVSVLDAIIRAVSEKGAYQTAYPLIPHLLHIAGFSREFTDEDAFPNVLVLVRWAEYLKNSGVYSSSEAVSQTCLARMGKAKGEDHPDYAINLNNLAGVLRSQGRYEEAEALYRRALAIDEQTIGPDHPDYATHLNNLALVLQAQGKYEEAEALYRRALAIDEQTIGTDHPEYAVHLNNLALVLESQGKYEEAEALYRRALSITEEAVGSGHPSYAIRLNNLGSILLAQGKYHEVETVVRRVLEIDEKTIGTDHPTYAQHLANLAVVLAAQNKLDEAEQSYRRALAISLEALGPEHPQTQTIQHNLDKFLASKK